VPGRYRRIASVQHSDVVFDDIKNILVGREIDAIGLGNIRKDQMHAAIGIDAIDAEDRLLDRFVAEVSRICEVDGAAPVDNQVVGSVERPAVVKPGQDVAAPALEVGSDDRAAAEVSPAR
jgi:hypothetical protein